MLKIIDLEQDVAQLAERLPTFPAIVIQLLDMLRDESSSLDMLARMARNDPVISANILARANHIRRMHAQSDLADAFVAASIIGINQVRRIVVTMGMNRFVSSVPGGPFLFHHSLAVAITVQEMAAFVGISPDVAYTAGMLHDVGQLCFHIMDEALFEEVYTASIVDGKLLEREAEAFGADHCQVGAQLARHWNLPDEIHSAILTHHDDNTFTGSLQASIYLSETMVRALDIPQSPKNRVTRLNRLAIEELGLDWGTPGMTNLFDRCVTRYQQMTRQ
ncbi:HDOD domain-containing protein [Rhodoferax sp.]|uniref:HDOD domain-containing protein n=1 Tax=Rhodoferax sp. TaxID=50421 RepID=UPI0028433B24|nr:HDOD domain-containing protein [Rhodoferax sp.]MDR3371992.1 HDOD domain-containing protein [Rhodoferax sp.]